MDKYKTVRGEEEYTYVSLERISILRKRGWKLSESTPLFQRRILLAGNMHRLRDGTINKNKKLQID